MLVGFISLALTIGQDSIVKIHIPYSWTKTMVQCHKTEEEMEEELEPLRLAQVKQSLNGIGMLYVFYQLPWIQTLLIRKALKCMHM
jgi:hypothetical protein